MLGPLPPTFLRIPPGSDARVDLSLEMDDDKIAAFLQNEEFMAELRWNQEFIAALDSEQGHKTKCHDDEAAFKERLKNMGKSKCNVFKLTSMLLTETEDAFQLIKLMRCQHFTLKNYFFRREEVKR